LPPAAARAAAEEQRQAAEAAVAEARVLRERCSQQGQAISQQQDKENQWKASAGLLARPHARMPACPCFTICGAWQRLCAVRLLSLPCPALPRVVCRYTFMLAHNSPLLQEREADLRLFVEVTTQACVPPSGAQELAEARVAEAKLREQLAELQRQLQASAQHQAAQTAAQRATAAQQQLDAAVEEASRLQAESTSLQRQLLNLQQQAADLKVSEQQRHTHM
jgi:hypothetical protein